MTRRFAFRPIVLVCGGRAYADHARVHEILHLHAAQACHIIHGGASGADALAEAWAQANGMPTMPFQADWRAHGLAAGPKRNQRMLEFGTPDVVIAFPGGRGTADMVRRAKGAGVPVIEVAP